MKETINKKKGKESKAKNESIVDHFVLARTCRNRPTYNVYEVRK